jgi:Zn-dependent M16 (insulinase) family peptidase
VSKAQNDIPSAKREGDDMARDVRNLIQLDESTSSRRATTTLRQETLLDDLEKSLEEDDESIVAKFDELRAECISPGPPPGPIRD